MAMTIANFIGLADTFTFPNNPRVFDISSSNNIEIQRVPHTGTAVVISTGSVFPKDLGLSGHFSGTSKRTYLRDLTKHVQQSNMLKKLVFETGKFHLVVGNRIKETNVGGRTNFIDYIVSFNSVSDRVFSTTLDTYTEGGSHVTNDGSANTVVFEIAGTVTSGSSAVTLTDSLGSAVSIPATSLTTGDLIIYRYVQNVPSGARTLTYNTQYGYVGIKAAYTNSGTTTSATAFKLNDTGGTPNFSTTVSVGDLVKNTTDGTYTLVTKVDSTTVLSIRDNIMASSEAYVIYAQSRMASTTSGTGILELGIGRTTADITPTNLAATYTIAIRDAWRA